jgi:hypothetical protein
MARLRADRRLGAPAGVPLAFYLKDIYASSVSVAAAAGLAARLRGAVRGHSEPPARRRKIIAARRAADAPSGSQSGQQRADVRGEGELAVALQFEE